MDRTSYLLLHIPGRGRLTLSFPGGVERAIRNGRLPGDTEALLEPEGVWLPLDRHPVFVSLLTPAPRSQPRVPPKVFVAGAVLDRATSDRTGWLASLTSIERWATSLAILLASTGAFPRPE